MGSLTVQGTIVQIIVGIIIGVSVGTAIIVVKHFKQRNQIRVTIRTAEAKQLLIIERRQDKLVDTSEYRRHESNMIIRYLKTIGETLSDMSNSGNSEDLDEAEDALDDILEEGKK